MEDHIKSNKDWWDQATKIHTQSRSSFYNLEDFKKGKSSLKSLELTELGTVKGKSLLHLQCHFGMDTLSWAREGASVTGVDFSEAAIEAATKLSSEINVPAEFVCSDVYNLGDVLKKEFDIVFTSYGAIAWLPDIKKWAETVARFVKKGGTFYIAEIHPLSNIFDREFKITGHYFKTEVSSEEAGPDYSDRQATINATSHNWSHTLGNIVTALVDSGLKIEFVHEFPFTVYDQFPGLLEENKDGYWVFKDRGIDVPLLFSLKATKG